MRAFFSIHITEKVAEQILGDLPKNPGLIWYPRQNLHVTLQFVGDVMANEMLKLLRIGEDAAKEIPVFFLRPSKIIFTENRVRLAIEPHPNLIKLHDSIEGALKSESLGKPDENLYAPHITLGRVSGASRDLPPHHKAMGINSLMNEVHPRSEYIKTMDKNTWCGGLSESQPDFKDCEIPVNSFGIFLSEQGANNLGSYTLFKEFMFS